MLKGKVALVTGSTSGIGLGIARALAAQGASLAINGFGDAAEIAALTASLSREFGIKVVYTPADVSKPAEVDAMIAKATADLGAVDILVNNAGIQHTALIQDFPVERWDAIIAINLTSAFHTTRLALPGMKQKG
jgi:3-hydroxybutyrate dehydrogenase